MIKKAVLKISGMHCTSCTMLIDGDLEDLEGVRSANTNYPKAECEVEFDEEVVGTEAIIKTIDKAGYQAQLKNK